MPDQPTRKPLSISRILLVTILVFLTVAVFSTSQTSVAAPRCPGATEPVQLTVTPFFGKIIYRMGNTRGDLKRIRDRHAGRNLPSQWYPLGLTQAQFEIRLNTNVTIQPLRTQRYCAFPHALEVNIGYPSFTIWIDRRYRRGTCEYQAILDHEHDHIRIYREQLRLHIDQFHLDIARILRRLRPATISSPNLAANQVQARLTQRIRPLVRKLEKITDSANAAIDTITSYQAIHDLCRNW